jgi:Rps23 Pro-64 3,4-dihydroxylase Tpa1-like proline 4-hydroxylase
MNTAARSDQQQAGGNPYTAPIIERIAAAQADLADQFRTPGRIESFVLDDLLPLDLANGVTRAFPPVSAMTLKKSLREDKYIGVQMNLFDPLCEQIIYAFQHPRIVELLRQICGIPVLEADHHLYAGGLSVMLEGQFLNPHLDNSHDRKREQYRVLNLLYYVSPEWALGAGGNLELWDGGLKAAPRVIHSRFNRLVCMATHRKSWHSVQPITVPEQRRCVSNYYFSPAPLESEHYFHVTSFRGRPEQPIRNLVLAGDALLRQSLRKVFRHGVRENPHVYKKD